MSRTTSIKAIIRVHANRTPPDTQELWDSAIELLNQEIYEKSYQILQDWLGLELLSTNTTLTGKCLRKRVCADLDIDMRFISTSLVPQREEHMVLGLLRHWMELNERSYAALWSASIHWTAPNYMVTPIGVEVDNVDTLMKQSEKRDFVEQTQQLLDPTVYHDVVLWNQFINAESHLEIHTYFLGSTERNNVTAYQNETVLLLSNRGSILGQPFLDSTTAHVFALREIDVTTASRSSNNDPDVRLPRGTPGYKRPEPQELDLFNTTHVAIGFGILVMTILGIACIVVIVRRKKLRDDLEKPDDDTDSV